MKTIDPVLREIYKAREETAAESGFDIDKMASKILENEKKGQNIITHKTSIAKHRKHALA